jgi:hypothetical protein
MLERVKMALRITTDVFDSELEDLIEAAYLDLGIAGVENTAASDFLIIRAVITFCKLNWGEPSDRNYDALKASYDEQKAQLATATGYTDWGTV